MSQVVIRCPNCGTTQASLGECEACHEGDTRYFCENHEPGLWLDAPLCSECGARFGETRERRPERPPPRSGRRARATPFDRAPLPRAEPEPSLEELWRDEVRAPRSAEVEEIGTPASRGDFPWPIELPSAPVGVRFVSAGGCLKRLVMLVVILLVLAAMAIFGLLGIGAEIFFGSSESADALRYAASAALLTPGVG